MITASPLRRHELLRGQAWLDGAWVGYLPSAFHRDPTPSNTVLYTALAVHAKVLRPVPTIRPDWPHWERALQAAEAAGAPAVRAYPAQWQLSPDDARMKELAIACGEAKLALILTVRFEDLRQRHPLPADLTLLQLLPKPAVHLLNRNKLLGA